MKEEKLTCTSGCHELPPFDWNDLASVREAFKGNHPHVFAQTWLDKNEPDFAPAQASAGWREESLFVFAELSDLDISTRAQKNNERLWELGDVFEIFLRPNEQEAYYEFHVAPNNHTLQLRFPRVGAVTAGTLDQFLIRESVFNSVVWLQPESSRWLVLAQIPAKTVCEAGGSMRGTVWNYSFCRYDYTRGREKPVISSTSALTIPKFHTVHQWSGLQFVT